MGLALCATFPRQEAVGGTRADPVLGGRAGCFLNEACGTWSPAAVALLDAILAPCEGALGAGAAVPLCILGAVCKHVGSCRALVAGQLGARLRVGVLILAGREEGLFIWAACGQNAG